METKTHVIILCLEERVSSSSSFLVFLARSCFLVNDLKSSFKLIKYSLSDQISLILYKLFDFLLVCFFIFVF